MPNPWDEPAGGASPNPWDEPSEEALPPWPRPNPVLTAALARKKEGLGRRPGIIPEFVRDIVAPPVEALGGAGEDFGRAFESVVGIPEHAGTVLGDAIGYGGMPPTLPEMRSIVEGVEPVRRPEDRELPRTRLGGLAGGLMSTLEIPAQGALGLASGHPIEGLRSGFKRTAEAVGGGIVGAAPELFGLDPGDEDLIPEAARESAEIRYGDGPTAGESFADTYGFEPSFGQAADTVASFAVPAALGIASKRFKDAPARRAALAEDAAHAERISDLAMEELKLGEDGPAPELPDVAEPEAPPRSGPEFEGPFELPEEPGALRPRRPAEPPADLDGPDPLGVGEPDPRGGVAPFEIPDMEIPPLRSRRGRVRIGPLDEAIPEQARPVVESTPAIDLPEWVPAEAVQRIHEWSPARRQAAGDLSAALLSRGELPPGVRRADITLPDGRVDLQHGWEIGGEVFSAGDLQPFIAAHEAASTASTANLIRTALGEGSLTAETAKLRERGAVGKRVYTDAEVARIKAEQVVAYQALRKRYPTPDLMLRAFRTRHPNVPMEHLRRDVAKVFAATRTPGMPQDAPPEGMPTESTGALPERFAGHLLEKYEGNEALRRSLADMAEANDQYRASRRDPVSTGGPGVSVAEMQAGAVEIAQAFGADPLVLLKEFRKLPERLTALREIAHKTTTEYLEARAEWKVDPSDANLARVGLAMTEARVAADSALAAGSEAGRTMRMLRETVKEVQLGSDLGKILDRMGGKYKLEQIVRAAEVLPDEDRAAFFRRAIDPASTADKVYEFWINSILSNPKTHVANFLSNAGFAIYVQTLEHGVAAMLPWSDITFKEVAQRHRAVKRAGSYAAKVAKQAWDLEHELIGGKWQSEGPRMAIEGKLGRYTRTSTRALGAADAGFKGVAYVQELEGLAVREYLRGKSGIGKAAREAGVEMQEFVDQVRNDGISVEPKLRRADGSLFETHAQKAAETLTFTEHSPTAAKLTAFNDVPGFRYLVPFKRTLANITKAGWRRTPLSIAGQEFRTAFKAGGEARDMAIARVGLGTAILGKAFAEATEGNITGGGPRNRDQKAVLYATGWMPYSAKIGDAYYSYSRLEPFATLLGLAADAAEIIRDSKTADADDVMWRVALASGHQLAGKSFAGAAGQLYEAMDSNDPTEIKKIASQTGAAFVTPGIVKALADQVDPALREERSYLDSILNRMPGGKAHLSPKRERTSGEPVEREWLGLDILSPVQVSHIKDNPVAKAYAETGVGIARVPDKVNLADGTVYELRDKEWDELAQESGQALYQAAMERVTAPDWEGLDQSARASALRAINRTAKKAAREAFARRQGLLLKGEE